MKTKQIELFQGKNELKLIQITDLHLFNSMHGELRGVNTFQNLTSILKSIPTRKEKIDIIIISGDISEDRSAGSYQLLKDELDKLEIFSLWLPGNHDDFRNMPSAIRDEHVYNSATIGEWKFIFLDTTIPGVDHGNLDKDELKRLNTFLKEHKKSPTVVCMHHPPIDVDSEFIDRLGLMNKEKFWEVIDSNPSPKAILFGHVHQVIDQRRNDILLSCPPATSMQWIPKSQEFAFTNFGKGYQLIDFSNNGKMTIKTIIV